MKERSLQFFRRLLRYKYAGFYRVCPDLLGAWYRQNNNPVYVVSFERKTSHLYNPVFRLLGCTL